MSDGFAVSTMFRKIGFLAGSAVIIVEVRPVRERASNPLP